MKKITLLFLLTAFCFVESYAQWSVVNTGTTQEVYSADYYSANTIWLGSYNQIITTANGGGTWKLVGNPFMASGVQVNPAIIKGIAVQNATSGICTGEFYGIDYYYAMTTTNGGTSWNEAYQSAASAPIYFSAVDVNGANSVLVGTKGYMIASSNSGSTWTVVTGAGTTAMSDVRFISHDTVIAVGNGRIIKSYDGGMTWPYDSTPTTTFYTVRCLNNLIYITGSTGLLKSTNYGSSYTTQIPPFGMSGPIAVASTNILLAAGGTNGLYISRTGGQYWEQCNLPKSATIDMISCLDSNHAIAVGKSGFAVMTTNLTSCPTTPIATFTVQGGVKSSYCLGDSVTLLNSTAPLATYTYKWQLNRATFSTQYNSGVRLSIEGSDTVSLIVANGTGVDTIKQVFTVVGHHINPITFTTSTDSICSGNLTGFSISNTQSGVTYQLRNGYTNNGTAQSGNGGTLTFTYTNGITSNTTLNIKAVRTTSCFTDSLIGYYNVVVRSSANTPKVICTPANNYCASLGITNVTFGAINNNTTLGINNYFDYSCCQNATVMMGHTYPMSVTVYCPPNESGSANVEVYIDFNNDGTFSVPSERVYYNTGADPVNPQTFTFNVTVPSNASLNSIVRMRVFTDKMNSGPCAGNGGYGCGQTADYAVTIIPDTVLPKPKFSFTTSTVCTATTTFTDSTYNATSWLWRFGDGTTSTLQNPSAHIYTVSGNYNVTLVTTNYKGTDSISQIVPINIPQVPIADSCKPTQYAYACTAGKLSMVTLNGVETFPGGGFTNDFTCTPQIHLTIDSSYTLIYQAGGNTVAWIDYNNDGKFPISGSERLVSGNISGSPTIMVPFTVPHTAVTSTPLRMRIVASGLSYINTACDALCGNYAEYTVFIDPYPVIALAYTASVTNTCTGDSVKFTNTTKNGTTWLWSFGDGGTSTAKSPTHTYTSPGVYTVKLKACNSFYCDSLTKTSYVTVVVTPAVTIKGNVTKCQGIADTLIASGGTSYTWSTGATTSSIIVSPAATATYSIAVKNAGGCVKDTSFTVTVNPKPVITASATIATICSGASTVLNASGAATYTWAPTGSLNVSTGSSVSATPASTITYSVNGASAFGCVATQTIVAVTVNATPTVSVTASPAGVCVGSTSTLKASGASAYTWAPNSALNATTGSSVNATPSATITYTVTGTTSGCAATNTVTVSINPTPVVTITGKTILCAGTPDTLVATGGTSYSWGSGATTGTVIVNPIVNITYTVGVSNNGCVKDTSITIAVNSSPTVKVIGDSLICAGNSTKLTASGATTYMWGTGATSSVIVVSPAATTTYTVTGTKGACSVPVTKIITVTPYNGFDLAGNLQVCIDTPKISGASIQACIFNNRCQVMSGQLKLVLDTAIHITNTISDSAALVSGDTLIWNYDSLSYFGKTHCVALTGTVSNVPVGDSVFVSMFITPTAGDSVPANNSITYWVKPYPYNCVGFPFDPNEKSVLPEGDISATQQLSYTIHFQNTGTAPAKNVVVIDTLSQYVDPTTLKVTSSSSKVVPTIVSGNIVKFTFDNIDLPDTATSKTSSIGVVQYTISPMSSATAGDVIKNNAGIYFDANPVVKTNTTISPIVGSPLGINKIVPAFNIAVFPNPFTTSTSVVFNTDGKHYIEVNDVTGRTIEKIECTGKQYELSGNNLAKGVYFIKAFNADKSNVAVTKVVLQ
ncbi:MAG TPA: PKD domain-containing protein [Bacteroidia bacterium]|nr:PKD domain-containing protein [Bacteroidia bacterium]